MIEELEFIFSLIGFCAFMWILGILAAVAGDFIGGKISALIDRRRKNRREIERRWLRL